jgi:hypothetical protein
MRVGNLQVCERRLMVPGSYKGRGGNGGSVPVPVGDDVIETLLPAIVGRPSDATLRPHLFGYHTGFVLSSSAKSDRTMTKRRRPTVVAMSWPFAISS